jgi:lambda family phage minor tail protein L
MRDDIPLSQAEDAQLLESSGFASLLTIQLVATVAGGGTVFLRFCANKAVTWQGYTFESIPFSLVGLGANASGEVVRPKLTLPNAAGAFSSYAHQGWLNNALVTRQLVRKADLDGNVNSFSQKKWRVSKVTNLTRDLISLELRSLFDGHNFKLPPRQYYPPEFPSVSLS